MKIVSTLTVSIRAITSSKLPPDTINEMTDNNSISLKFIKSILIQINRILRKNFISRSYD
jgi:hypothetical protein